MVDAAPQKVIVEGLNYAHVTPETIDSEIRLVKFQPTASIGDLLPGNQVKFLLQGGGFLDPMSTYLRFTVTVDDLASGEIRFVDRSAHSFINRLYITSNGVEAERIEDYDVFAAMMNDSLYSSEQQLFHSFEGFPSQQYYFGDSVNLGNSKQSNIETVTDSTFPTRIAMPSNKYKRDLGMILSGSAASSNMFCKVGEPAFFNNVEPAAINRTDYFVNVGADPTKKTLFQDLSYSTLGRNGEHLNVFQDSFLPDGISDDPVTYDMVYQGQAISRIRYEETLKSGSVPTQIKASMLGQASIQFTIPIYSSLIGCIMPEHRFIPLHVLPLDIEFTLSRYALYSSIVDGSRNYKISRMEIFANMLFFFNDIPKQVEDTVGQHGIFLHLSSYYRAPKTIISGTALPGVAQIQMNFNAVNSVHFVFSYMGYQSFGSVRKLHFVSHGMKKLQLQNGTFQIPNEPIESLGVIGGADSNNGNSHIPFITEWLKAMNKLHDPSLDTGIYANNYCFDTEGPQANGLSYSLSQNITAPILMNSDNLQFHLDGWAYGALTDGNTKFADSVRTNMQTVLQLVQKQGNVGRAQYAISLEGEQLSEVRTAITGRKAVLPFNLSMTGNKAQNSTSEMYIFLRHDAILEIKPDLSIKLTR